MRTLFVAVIIAGLTVSSARADSPSAARELFRRATNHFSVGKFKKAAGEYEQLFEQHPDQYSLLFNIAQCYRLDEQPEKALFFYKRYLTNSPTAENAGYVKERIAELEKTVGEHKSEAGAGETAPAETAPPPAAAAPAPATPAPETATPAATTPASDAATVTAPSPARSDRKPLYKKWWLWAAVGGVLVAGAVVTTAVVVTRPAPFKADYPDFGPGVKAASLSLQWRF